MDSIDGLTEVLYETARPFSGAQNLGPLIEKVKDKKVVLMGEASHGTHEYYKLRAELSRELLLHHDFEFIAIEGDYPFANRISKSLKGLTTRSLRESILTGSRWPHWMWGNYETYNFLNSIQQEKNIDFYGLDIYSFYNSMQAVVSYLTRFHPNVVSMVTDYFTCIESFGPDPISYAKKASRFPNGCREQIEEVTDYILNQIKDDDPNLFDAAQNARVVDNAEKYYRTVLGGGESSWNIRDRHMMDTLTNLLSRHEKGIVWAHNTHVGDYRATSMDSAGLINIGGLAREEMGEENVSLIGFGSYAGEVMASQAWDERPEVMKLPEAPQDSYEAAMHKLCRIKDWKQFYIDLESVGKDSPLNEERGHRAVGVVYNPKRDSSDQYVPTKLSSRYDHFLFIDQTTAVKPLQLSQQKDNVIPSEARNLSP